MTPDLLRWTENLEWQSETQRKGFLALVLFLDRLPVEATASGLHWAAVAAFFIQKDHESHEWWAGVAADVEKRLQGDIKALRDATDERLEGLHRLFTKELETLRAACSAVAREGCEPKRAGPRKKRPLKPLHGR